MTTAIIQARMSSTRLPGKVLLDLAGQPMLARVVERAQQARTIDRVIVATTVEPEDEPIVGLCHSRGWAVSRGSRDDVLDRYYQAALSDGADSIVRITSDCPLIDPGVIDQVVAQLEAARLTESANVGAIDYASNINPKRTYPRGLDVEVFTFAALSTAWREDREPTGREHVTPFLYRNPERFRIALVESDRPEAASHRWSVDTPEDYELLRRIYEHFRDDDFTWEDVLDLLAEHPQWVDLNRHVEQKPH
ncbi:MAG TPA: glycosyltransferase family protein [Planctomycetaceae bacterium]|jgi:spore coat polysaccharide biosynthesis protein SpsF|nr:glycosyltransferase family protein [Planctomycetaceae bacterium]